MGIYGVCFYFYFVFFSLSEVEIAMGVSRLDINIAVEM